VDAAPGLPLLNGWRRHGGIDWYPGLAVVLAALERAAQDFLMAVGLEQAA